MHLQYLAVRAAPRPRNPILCFAGPPGVGKIRSDARSRDGRKFVRLSLGGVRDEAEIRATGAPTSALPVRIVQSLKTAGSNNPLFVLTRSTS